MDILERFENKYIPEPNTGCWLWVAHTNRCGYGTFGVAGRTYLAHRVSYNLHIGDIPKHLELDHKCRVRSCVNPSHLEPVTHKENMSRSPLVRKAGAYNSAKNPLQTWPPL